MHLRLEPKAMGGKFCRSFAVWTFFEFFACFLQTVCAHNGLLHDLGLNILPDIAKINISLDEYTTMMNTYLESRENSSDNTQNIPKLTTFNLERSDWWQPSEKTYVRLKFPISKTSEAVELESAQLRILAPPQPLGPSTVRVKLYQILGTRRRRFIEERVVYLSKDSPKWCQFDVSSLTQMWLNGERNLGLELVCSDCTCSIYPQEAAVTALVYPEGGRSKRAVSPYQPERKTDCREGGTGRRKCCRHKMTVTFSELKFHEMASILEPRSYEAGYCQGQCPPSYNHATNHSRIQSLVHQMERKNRSVSKPVPKACCAPSKLRSLQILRVDPNRPNKLMVESWDNMEVIECSCS